MKIAIIGGGIIGLATAHQLLKNYPGHTICLLEKENEVGRHQSTHNSGVLHAGLYYKPGSLKAKLAVRGIRQMKAFCESHSIPHETCGKLVVATNLAEKSRLKALFERGNSNGLSGIKKLKKNQMLEIEPHVSGLEAIQVPEEGIVDFDAVCKQMRESIDQAGGQVILNYPVNRLTLSGHNWVINQNSSSSIQADFIINTSGLYCDKVASLTGVKPKSKIIPFRGEYFKIKKNRSHLVKNLIYPVPDPKFPFLGVHFTRMIHGGIEAGPNAVLAFSREGYRKTDIKVSELLDALTYSGLWKFGAKHYSMCWQELRHSFSKSLFCKALQNLVPEIEMEDLEPGGAGVRAQALSPKGVLEQDFVLQPGSKMLHVLNAPSPGATASLAIADQIIFEIKCELN